MLSRAVAAGGVALLLGAVAAPAAAQSGAEGGCPVVSAAQGLQIMVDAPVNVLLEEPSGAALSVAQACVNYALSDSMGFASNPYPGGTPLTLLRTVGSSLGEGTGQPPPEYPGYVASRHPGESESRVEQPGYSLGAKSTETSSRSRAQAGPAQDASEAGAMATAESVVDPGALTGRAVATSDTQPLTFNGVLELGRVRSTASAAVDAKGSVRRESSLSIGRTTVAGQAVQITPRGVEAAGQTVPGPGADPAEALEAAGIEVRYLAEEKSARGVLSAGVDVVVKQENPDSPGSYNQVHYTVGRSFAAADKVERPVGGGPGVGLPGSPGDVGPVDETAVAGDSGPVADAPVAGSVAPEAASAPEAAPGPDAAPAPQVAAPAGWVGRPMDMGMAGFYLVLVCGAVAMVAGMTLLRLLGVRTQWTS